MPRNVYRVRRKVRLCSEAYVLAHSKEEAEDIAARCDLCEVDSVYDFVGDNYKAEKIPESEAEGLDPFDLEA